MKKTSALQAWLKFASMKKQVTGPWSSEEPHNVARAKIALEEPPPPNTMQRPKQHPLFDGNGAVTDGTANYGTETPYTATAAFPWDNEYLDR